MLCAFYSFDPIRLTGTESTHERSSDQLWRRTVAGSEFIKVVITLRVMIIENNPHAEREDYFPAIRAPIVSRSLVTTSICWVSAGQSGSSRSKPG